MARTVVVFMGCFPLLVVSVRPRGRGAEIEYAQAGRFLFRRTNNRRAAGRCLLGFASLGARLGRCKTRNKVGNVTVIGAQWGDEGKGKIVDWLASRADMVVRFQGGHNAGHTLVVGNQTYKFSLLPSRNRPRHAVGHRQWRGPRSRGR